jgi:hypothetical protein
MIPPPLIPLGRPHFTAYINLDAKIPSHIQLSASLADLIIEKNGGTFQSKTLDAACQEKSSTVLLCQPACGNMRNRAMTGSDVVRSIGSKQAKIIENEHDGQQNIQHHSDQHNQIENG